MSAIQTYIQIEHIRLEAGEVLILDGVIYLIESVERLLYPLEIALTPSVIDSPTTVTQLRPEDDEVYHVEYVGITHEFYENNVHYVFPSGAIFRLAYPRGDPRYGPHGLPMPLDEGMASNVDPIRVDLWIKPATEPDVIASNTLPQAVHFQVWFFGWKYRTKLMTKADLEAARSRDVRVLEIERYVSK